MPAKIEIDSLGLFDEGVEPEEVAERIIATADALNMTLRQGRYLSNYGSGCAIGFMGMLALQDVAFERLDAFEAAQLDDGALIEQAAMLLGYGEHEDLELEVEVEVEVLDDDGEFVEYAYEYQTETLEGEGNFIVDVDKLDDQRTLTELVSDRFHGEGLRMEHMLALEAGFESNMNGASQVEEALYADLAKHEQREYWQNVNHFDIDVRDGGRFYEIGHALRVLHRQ